MQASKVAALAEARKAADAKRRIMSEEIQREKALMSKVYFEINTTDKIRRNNQNRAVAKLKEGAEQELFGKRKALADIMNKEMEVWKAECLGSVETMESRKAKLLDKATALKNERESQRLKYVENAYEERWREECDDVRDLDGKALSVFMAAEREKQVKEKKVRDREHAQKENDFIVAWEKQLAKMAALDDEKIANAKSQNLSTFEGLKQQIAERDAAKQQHYDNMMKEAEDEIAEVKAAIGTEEARERQRKLDEIARGKEVLAFNAKYKDIAAENAAIEAEHDKQLLEHALMEERTRIKEEQDKQKAGADAAKQYRKYLEEMMVKEAEDNGFVDEINKREEEKIWKARDDALQARQDARDYLMKLVQEGREEQIAYKAKVAADEKEEGKLFAKKFMSEIAEGVAKDREAVEARRAKNVANLHSLREQMAERKKLAELEEQDKYLDNKRMQYIEKQHQEKLSRQGGVVRTFHPKRKSDV